MGPCAPWAVAARRRAGKGALIPEEPPRSLSASSNSGEPHETRGYHQPAWRRGGSVAANGAGAGATRKGETLACNQLMIYAVPVSHARHGKLISGKGP
jgi:hypothetical protein